MFENSFWTTVLNRLEDGITLSNSRGEFVLYNQSMVTLTGYSLEEVANDDFLNILFDDAFQKKKAMDQIHKLATEKSVSSEMSIQTKSGQKKHVLISSTRLAVGDDMYYLSVYHDVTEFHDQKELLRSEKNKLLTLLETIPDIIYFKDYDGRNTIVNKAFENLVDMPKEEIIGKTDEEIFPRDLADACNASDAEVISAKNPLVFEEKRLNGNGETYFATYKAPLYEKGSFLGIVGVTRDVTEEKSKEKLLKENERRFRSIFEGSSDGIIAVEPSTGNILFSNKSLSHLTGRSQTELKGLTINDIHPKKDLEYVQNQFKMQLEGKISIAKDIPVLHANGTITYCDINASPLELDGSMIMVGFFRDITEKKRAEALKNQFLSITSHELRTPLTPMKGQLQLLLRGLYGEVNEKQSHALDVMLRNVDRLNRLISDILDFSKIQSDNMKFSLERSNITTTCHQAIATLQQKADEKNVALVGKIEDIGDFVFDADRISQVILNLINNAIKFTDKNGSVTVVLTKEENKVHISVADTGIGINKEDQDRIFSPFEQVDASFSRNHEGTGLGLSICKGIVLFHRGKIWIESELGKGAEFHFTLPCNLEPTLASAKILQQREEKNETFKKAWDLEHKHD